MKDSLFLFLKGVAIGAANVIPGVSGGTIAFITGIYETLINSLKAVDITAVKLFFSFKLKEFAEHINLRFLFTLFLGVGISLVSLGKLADFLFKNYNIWVWSFFFGLIAISVYSVSKEVQRWKPVTILLVIVGTALAVALAYKKPAGENAHYLYLVFCGVIAMASMILPGLSGSFVLILLGNYQLIMLRAAPELDFKILLPVIVGAIVGFLFLSRSISFLLKNFYNQTISLLAGFILGSLVIIWPWKNPVFLSDEAGFPIIKEGEKIVQGYDWYLPGFDMELVVSVLLMITGVFLVLGIEYIANKSKEA
ncbi:MAG: DUF368 domain-containing protein [Cyclobacteriaceae bacterium]